MIQESRISSASYVTAPRTFQPYRAIQHRSANPHTGGAADEQDWCRRPELLVERNRDQQRGGGESGQKGSGMSAHRLNR
jgi:hypothetical protein